MVATPAGRSLRVYIFAATAMVGMIVAIFVAVVRPRGRLGTPPVSLTEEQKAYLARIVIVDTQMSAARNFLGDTVTSLDAKLTNNGLHLVRSVELRVEFHDSLNQVVLREEARPVTRHTPPLKPGETRAFRLYFEHMPADWNQAPPSVTATQVEF